MYHHHSHKKIRVAGHVAGSLGVFALLFIPSAVFGEVQYKPMVGFPGVAAGTGTTLGQYLPAAYKMLIGVSVILAVVMLVMGGVKLIGSAGSESLRGEGKKDIWGAITGLLIIAISWIVLYAINPDLTTIRFNIAPAPAAETASGAGPEEGVVAGGGGTAPAVAAGQPWPSDTQERSLFSPVAVKEPTCTTVGMPGCTSVYNIGPSAITGAKKLQAGCGCSVTITGGTEYWLHSTHKAGAAIVDIRDTSEINAYLTGSGSAPRSGIIVNKDGGRYVYEASGANAKNTYHHWHVVY